MGKKISIARCVAASLLLLGATGSAGGQDAMDVVHPPSTDTGAASEDYFDQFLLTNGGQVGTEMPAPVVSGATIPCVPGTEGCADLPSSFPSSQTPYYDQMLQSQSPLTQGQPSTGMGGSTGTGSSAAGNAFQSGGQATGGAPQSLASAGFAPTANPTSLAANTIGDFIGWNTGIGFFGVNPDGSLSGTSTPMMASPRILDNSYWGSLSPGDQFTTTGSTFSGINGPVLIPGATYEVTGTTLTDGSQVLSVVGNQANLLAAVDQVNQNDPTIVSSLPVTTQLQPDSFVITPSGEVVAMTDYVAGGLVAPTVLPMPGMQISKYKVAEAGSPIPRDRVFFHQSFFQGTSLSAPGNSGIDMNRFVPGFEKTFFNGNGSLEVRVPFASSVSSDIYSTPGLTNTSDVQLGNMVFNLKSLLINNGTRAFAAGVAVELPTADDLNYIVSNDFGNPSVIAARVRNEAVHIAPYIGSVYAPTDRFFVNSFLQVDFDANGNPVDFASGGQPLAEAGRWDAPTTLFADVSAGYWFYRNPAAQQKEVSGLAGILELHYNSTLESTNAVRNSLGNFQVGQVISHLDMLNLTIGSTLELGNSATATVAYATPLTNGQGRQFDGEFRVNFNYFFGRRNRLQRVPTGL